MTRTYGKLTNDVKPSSFVKEKKIVTDIRDGYSSIIDEIKKQLNGKIPSCLMLSVGGGGMLLGFMTGLKRHGKLENFSR